MDFNNSGGRYEESRRKRCSGGNRGSGARAYESDRACRNGRQRFTVPEAYPEDGKGEMSTIRSLCYLLFILALSMFAMACAATRTTQKVVDGTVTAIDEISDSEKSKLRMGIAKDIREGLNAYRLSPGDVVEVMYHLQLAAEAQDYRIGVNDELNVDFYYQPGINRTVVVRPDGKITLPLKGDYSAAGMRPVQLASVIAESYSDILNNPVVTVTVNKYSSKITELQKAITNAPRGQAKIVTVGPDGSIYLPLLRPVRAAGKTIEELKDAITAEYRFDFNNLNVSVLIESMVGNRTFVFGEIQRPGPLQMAKPMTVLQAVAMAGGVLPTGSLEKVKILYWDEKNQPILRTINLQNVMFKLRVEEDIIVPNNSVIFVPRTTIARMDRWVDQYIKQLFLWQGEVASIGFGYQIYTAPTTTR
jgi:polysaccharide biosynthesis/export protein PslD